MLKRIFALFLAGCTLTGLCACGKKQENNSQVYDPKPSVSSELKGITDAGGFLNVPDGAEDVETYSNSVEYTLRDGDRFCDVSTLGNDIGWNGEIPSTMLSDSSDGVVGPYRKIELDTYVAASTELIEQGDLILTIGMKMPSGDIWKFHAKGDRGLVETAVVAHQLTDIYTALMESDVLNTWALPSAPSINIVQTSTDFMLIPDCAEEPSGNSEDYCTYSYTYDKELRLRVIVSVYQKSYDNEEDSEDITSYVRSSSISEHNVDKSDSRTVRVHGAAGSDYAGATVEYYDTALHNLAICQCTTIYVQTESRKGWAVNVVCNTDPTDAYDASVLRDAIAAAEKEAFDRYGLSAYLDGVRAEEPST